MVRNVFFEVLYVFDKEGFISWEGDGKCVVLCCCDWIVVCLLVFVWGSFIVEFDVVWLDF